MPTQKKPLTIVPTTPLSQEVISKLEEMGHVVHAQPIHDTAMPVVFIGQNLFRVHPNWLMDGTNGIDATAIRTLVRGMQQFAYPAEVKTAKVKTARRGRKHG